jgi:hypothetical protein
MVTTVAMTVKAAATFKTAMIVTANMVTVAEGMAMMVVVAVVMAKMVEKAADSISEGTLACK